MYCVCCVLCDSLRAMTQSVMHCICWPCCGAISFTIVFGCGFAHSVACCIECYMACYLRTKQQCCVHHCALYCVLHCALYFVLYCVLCFVVLRAAQCVACVLHCVLYCELHHVLCTVLFADNIACCLSTKLRSVQRAMLRAVLRAVQSAAQRAVCVLLFIFYGATIFLLFSYFPCLGNYFIDSKIIHPCVIFLFY